MWGKSESREKEVYLKVWDNMYANVLLKQLTKRLSLPAVGWQDEDLLTNNTSS